MLEISPGCAMRPMDLLGLPSRGSLISPMTCVCEGVCVCVCVCVCEGVCLGKGVRVCEGV